jgi:hypothetical protein
MWDDDEPKPFVEALELPRVKIGMLARAFEAASTPYAFGGAIALEFAGTPRGSWDIDVTMFVPDSDAPAVLNAAGAVVGGIHFGRALAVVEREGQVRLDWDGTSVDLFFSYDPFHEAARDRARQVSFDGSTIGVLSPEDLVILKVLADRERDWEDVEDVLRTQGATFDLAYVRHWLEALCGVNRAKPGRFETTVRAAGLG